jgi:aromatic-L-amino-acid decarboxylase
MDGDEFKRHGHALVDWIGDYLEQPERYPVLAQVSPGDVRSALPSSAPERGEPFAAIFADVERVLVPALTHWNHPGFFAYFANSSSGTSKTWPLWERTIAIVKSPCCCIQAPEHGPLPIFTA